MSSRGLAIAALVRLLTLLVYRCREIFRHVRARLVVGCGELQHRQVSDLRIFELCQLERRVTDHQPGGASNFLLRPRIPFDQPARLRERALVIFHFVQIVGSGAEHHRGLLVLRERLGKSQ